MMRCNHLHLAYSLELASCTINNVLKPNYTLVSLQFVAVNQCLVWLFNKLQHFIFEFSIVHIQWSVVQKQEENCKLKTES